MEQSPIVADSHAFELTVRRDALPDLARSINARMAPGTSPVGATDLLALTQGKHPGGLAVSLVFRTDQALSALAAEHPEWVVSDDCLALGYVYISATARDGEVDVCFFSTSHLLASAMRESSEVRSFFRSLAPHAIGGRVSEVNEWHETRPL